MILISALKIVFIFRRFKDAFASLEYASSGIELDLHWQRQSGAVNQNKLGTVRDRMKVATVARVFVGLKGRYSNLTIDINVAGRTTSLPQTTLVSSIGADGTISTKHPFGIVN